MKTENYNLLKKVGQGNFGEVWKAERDGKVIAIKIIEVGSEKMKENALREIKLLKEISNPSCHPSLACLYDYKMEEKKLFLEMEFIQGETLTTFSKGYRQTQNFLKLYKLLVAVLHDICKGLEYMHSKGIIHRDVKPDNIMIDTFNNPKLIDIGLSCTIFDAKTEKPQMCRVGHEFVSSRTADLLPCCPGYAGTPLYLSPETLLDNVSYFSSDIFSLGATIYFAANGRGLFPGVKNLSELQRATEEKSYPLLQTPNITLNTLVNNMIVKDPTKRMTAKRIVDTIEH